MQKKWVVFQMTLAQTMVNHTFGIWVLLGFITLGVVEILPNPPSVETRLLIWGVSTIVLLILEDREKCRVTVKCHPDFEMETIVAHNKKDMTDAWDRMKRELEAAGFVNVHSKLNIDPFTASVPIQS